MGASVKIFLLTLLGLLAFSNAFADCAAVPEKRVEVKIDNVSAPVFDAKGKYQEGCILSSGGEVLGYATEDRLCHLPSGQTIKVSLFQAGCCDTGTGDGGDFTCVIRAWSFAGMQTVYGNGVIVQTVAP